MECKLERSGQWQWEDTVLIQVIRMGNFCLMGHAVMFNFGFNTGGVNFLNSRAGLIVRTLEDVEVGMMNLKLFTEWANHALTSGRVHMTLLDISNAQVLDIVHAWQEMFELAGQTILQVNQSEDIVKHSRSWSRWGGMLNWIQSSENIVGNICKLRKR